MRVFIILILMIMYIKGDDFFISFSLVNKNGKIISYDFKCSRALTYKYSKKKFLFSLPLVKDIKTTCKIYQDKIINFLLKENVIVYSNEKLSDTLISRIKLTFLPKRFDIIIKNGVIKFYLKE